MVTPRLRSRNSNAATTDLFSLPVSNYGRHGNINGYHNDDDKASKGKVVSNPFTSTPSSFSSTSTPVSFEKQFKLVHYKYVMNHEKELMLLLPAVALIFYMCTSGMPWVVWASETYPWKHHIRPAHMKNIPHSFESSDIYKPKESIMELGDKTDFYAKLRQSYDTKFPDNTQRSLEVVESRRNYDINPFLAILKNRDNYYDIYNCPPVPPPNYPYNYKLVDILQQWPADDPYPTERIYQSLCVFDYQTDYEKAMTYRNAELPFVLKGDPAVAKTVERWQTPYYLKSLIGNVDHDVEYSKTNHFLSWSKPIPGKSPKDWKPPTKWMSLNYMEWLYRANVSADKLGPNMPHWQFRISGCRETNMGCMKTRADYVWDELPFYQPKSSLEDNGEGQGGSIYVKDPKWQKSVHCKFGMQGVIAESHFHSENQMYTMLKGERRYIISPPNQCQKMALYPEDHPSRRFSKINWSDPTSWDKYPQFKEAEGNEVVLQAGESLYLPSVWFHHIISLSLNAQCTTSSGYDTSHFDDIEKCGYHII